MSNRMYNKIKYIYWAKEATKIVLNADDMKKKIEEVAANRAKIESKTKRADFTNDTYNIDKHGDYYELYLFEDGQYRIYSCNGMDDKKNKKRTFIRADQTFDYKFRELNGLSLRKAFGFCGAQVKRCIPKQFYYINERLVNKIILASSIDASSQYPSGCLGKLPDAHTKMAVRGRAYPTEEYPFAFYSSGHLAIYGELDTHDWFDSKYFLDLFRYGDDEYALQNVRDEDEITVLCKASQYTMDSTWEYFYNAKKSCKKGSDDYNKAKLVMNSTIGQWHRKDKDMKRVMTYDDHGSYQMAHIAAVAIARGNQKILNKVKELNELRIAHICVDGIIYLGDDITGSSESKMGQFEQEFAGCQFMMTGINCYAAEKDGKPVKFKHGGYDLIDGHDIDDRIIYGIKDLSRLSAKERIGEILDGKKKI